MNRKEKKRTGLASRIRQLETYTHRLQSGDALTCYVDFRDVVKPNWRMILEPKKATVPQEKIDGYRKIAASILELCHRIASIEEWTNALEIGCGSGSLSLAMAECSGLLITASDVTDYWDREMDSGDASDWLNATRRSALSHYPQRVRNQVDFQLIDAQKEIPGSYDLIFSAETLEHILDLSAALRNMYRALAPGGALVHRYNPFFSFTGGHSLCSLDWPFGHAMLSPREFEHFLSVHRPEEREFAMLFYRESLNRVTLNQLDAFLRQSDWDYAEIVPWINNQHWDLIDSTTLNSAQTNYPEITMTDLASPSVFLIATKPR